MISLLFCQIWLKIASEQCFIVAVKEDRAKKNNFCSLIIWCLWVIEQTWLRRGLTNFCPGRNKPIWEKSPLPSILTVAPCPSVGECIQAQALTILLMGLASRLTRGHQQGLPQWVLMPVSLL